MVHIYWTKKHVWATKVTILFGWWKLIVTSKLFVHFFRFSHFWFFVLMPLCTQKTRLFKSTENILMPSAFAWVLTQIFLLKAIKSYFTQNMTKEVKLINLFLFLKTLHTHVPYAIEIGIEWEFFFHIYDKCWKPIGGILNKIRQDQKELKRVKWKQQVVKNLQPAHQRSDNLGISLIEGFFSYLWRMLNTHWRPVAT